MRELTPQDFAMAIFMSVCERKSRSRLRLRRQSAIIDDCIEMLKEGPLCPSLIRYEPGGVDLEAVRRRKLCAETLAYFERVAPVVRAMAGTE